MQKYVVLTILFPNFDQHSSFERFVPASWYRKVNDALQLFRQLQQQLFNKIPRIILQSPVANADDVVYEIGQVDNEEDEDLAVKTFEGKGKGKGKNRRAKASIEL